MAGKFILNENYGFFLNQYLKIGIIIKLGVAAVKQMAEYNNGLMFKNKFRREILHISYL